MRPMKYAVYKGMSGKFGAIQFSLQDPHFYKGKLKDFSGNEAFDENGKLQEGWQQREGCIFIETAPTTGENVYDWNNKITFALSVDDAGKVLHFLSVSAAENSLNMMHDPKAKSSGAGETTKNLKMFTKDGVMNKGCMVSMEQKDGGKQTANHQIPLAPSECIVLRSLLAAAIPKFLNW